jgi:hypothetical protein
MDYFVLAIFTFFQYIYIYMYNCKVKLYVEVWFTYPVAIETSYNEFIFLKK